MTLNNVVPEKINAWKAYSENDALIGVTGSMDLPEIKTKTSTVSGAGIQGEFDSPTVGQFESMEQEITFSVLHSSFADMFKKGKAVNLTLRAAQQVLDKTTGGYSFKGARIVMRGIVKARKLGKLENGEAMEASVTLELSYLKVENDGEVLFELDKLNGVYKEGGEDMLEEINSLI